MAEGLEGLANVAGGAGEGFVVGTGDVGDVGGEEPGVVAGGKGTGASDGGGALVGVVKDILEHEGEVVLAAEQVALGGGLHGGGSGEVGVGGLAAPVGRVAAASVDHHAHGAEVVAGVGGVELGIDGLPVLGFVFDDDVTRVGRDAVLGALFLDFIGGDGDQPEEGADGPVEADAVFEHARVALEPGDHGGEVGFAEQGTLGAVDGIVEQDGVGVGCVGVVG